MRKQFRPIVRVSETLLRPLYGFVSVDEQTMQPRGMLVLVRNKQTETDRDNEKQYTVVYVPNNESADEPNYYEIGWVHVVTENEGECPKYFPVHNPKPDKYPTFPQDVYGDNVTLLYSFAQCAEFFDLTLRRENPEDHYESLYSDSYYHYQVFAHNMARTYMHSLPHARRY